MAESVRASSELQLDDDLDQDWEYYSKRTAVSWQLENAITTSLKVINIVDWVCQLWSLVPNVAGDQQLTSHLPKQGKQAPGNRQEAIPNRQRQLTS